MESVSATVPLMPPPSAPHLLLQERIPSSFAVRRSCCFVSLALPLSQPERRSPYPEIRFDLRRRSVGLVALRTEGERERGRPTGASTVYVHLTDFAYLTKCY